jgi:putative membrane protein insertion efficiency factor
MTGSRRARAGLLAAVRFYQRAVSPAFPPRCRFQPTCSAYAAEAIELHGAARGSWLALRRLAKCAPWHPGGVDLVPPQGGTAAACDTSSIPTPPASRAGAPPRPDRATPPAPRRAAQEESSLA